MALAKHKLDEQARLEVLRLEEEVAIAVAKANAIDDELGYGDSAPLSHLNIPEENPSQRVQSYIENQCTDPPHDMKATPLSTNDVHNPSTEHVMPQPQHVHPVQDAPTLQPLIPTVNTFTPGSHLTAPSKSDQNTMKSCIEFMAGRELIAKKIEKFDNIPENYHTWKLAFKNMISGINITPSEELSLLIEYTTNESKKLTQKLRNAYIDKPKKGVTEVWAKLGERYGSNIVLTKAHLDKLTNFPKIGLKDNKKLQEFGDVVLELQCAKDNGRQQGLKILDEPIFMKPVLVKLPGDVQNRWQKHAFSYKEKYGVDYPPFTEFSRFIQDLSRERNDPNLIIERPENDHPPPSGHIKSRRSYKTHIAEREEQKDATNLNLCVIHQRPHSLNKCRAFRAKPIEERKSIVRQNNLCFRCLASNTHMAKDYKIPIKCSECGSEKHLSALHVDRREKPNDPDKVHGGEHKHENQQGRDGSNDQQQNDDSSRITTTCTEICGGPPGGRSCSKICLANIYVKEHPERKVKAYVLIDDQSNCSLATPQLFDLLNIDGEKFPYSLRTCAGTMQTEGRHATGLVIETLDGHKPYLLPTVTECDAIPDNKDEIPSPDIAKAHPHLRPIANQIPEPQRDVDILLLIGRDAPPLHKVRESRNGKGNSPWAQRLDLGWVILGNACLDGVHKPNDLTSCKTHLLMNGRPSIFEPCSNVFHVNHPTPMQFSPFENPEDLGRKESFIQGKFEDGLGSKVYERTKLDNRPGLSVEDRKFIKIMDAEMEKNESGSWVAPLPFRKEVTYLPSSREEALNRLKSTRKTLDSKPSMKAHYFALCKRFLKTGTPNPFRSLN